VPAFAGKQPQLALEVGGEGAHLGDDGSRGNTLTKRTTGRSLFPTNRFSGVDNLQKAQILVAQPGRIRRNATHDRTACAFARGAATPAFGRVAAR